MDEKQRLELKVQALLEKMSGLENQIADLRVELTIVDAERQQLKSEKENAQTSQTSESSE